MKEIKNRYFEGERFLYGLNDANLDGITFGEGESPLKEAQNTTFETMSRSDIWYTKNISIKNSALQAPKLFRRASHIILDSVHFADAEETMWTCDDIKITNSQINGDYFGKDSKNIYLDNVSVVGNYVFDGAENIEVHNSTFVSKDAFGIVRTLQFITQLLMANIRLGILTILSLLIIKLKVTKD